MNIKEKMQNIIETFDASKHQVKEYSIIDYNSDGIGKVDYVIPEGHEIKFLSSYINDYEKYGSVSGYDGKGYRVEVVNVELIEK